MSKKQKTWQDYLTGKERIEINQLFISREILNHSKKDINLRYKINGLINVIRNRCSQRMRYENRKAK